MLRQTDTINTSSVIERYYEFLLRQLNPSSPPSPIVGLLSPQAHPDSLLVGLCCLHSPLQAQPARPTRRRTHPSLSDLSVQAQAREGLANRAVPIVGPAGLLSAAPLALCKLPQAYQAPPLPLSMCEDMFQGYEAPPLCFQ